MQSPTFTFRQCVRYLRSSEMTSLFACISDLTLFMRMDPQGLEKHSFATFLPFRASVSSVFLLFLF